MTYIPPSSQKRSEGDRPILVNPRQMWFPWAMVFGIALGVWQVRGWREALDRRLESIELVLEARFEALTTRLKSVDAALDYGTADRFRQAEFRMWHAELQRRLDEYADRYEAPRFELPDPPAR